MRTFVFPGQGSQSPGMGAAFADHDCWSLVSTASEVTGRDVAHLLLHADADELRETRNAQLGTFVGSMLALEALRSAGVSPNAVAGHSLGEYSALCAAGVLRFEDAVRLVGERGEAMQAATTSRAGTMAAVLGLDDAAVEATCEALASDAWVANYNAPGQVVIAGDPGVLDKAAAAAKEAGAKRVMPLEVSGAFHTPFMAPAADRLRAAISTTAFHDASLPVVANVDAANHTTGADWPDLLDRQLTSPVRWSQSVETLVGLGADTFVEVGPGAVLVGTVKRIARDATRHTVNTPDDVANLAATIGGQQ